jgi:hypothetical protein
LATRHVMTFFDKVSKRRRGLELSKSCLLRGFHEIFRLSRSLEGPSLSRSCWSPLNPLGKPLALNSSPEGSLCAESYLSSDVLCCARISFVRGLLAHRGLLYVVLGSEHRMDWNTTGKTTRSSFWCAAWLLVLLVWQAWIWELSHWRDQLPRICEYLSLWLKNWAADLDQRESH